MCFYFLEYASRSAPAVMIPELTQALGTTAVGVSAILGTYYYTYSVTSLIAGAALDRVGGKKAVPVGMFILAVGCLLFSIPTATRDMPGDCFRAQVRLLLSLAQSISPCTVFRLAGSPLP